MEIISIEPINGHIDKVVSVPGSKSYSQRALFIQALCEQPFKITNLLSSADTDAMRGCLKSVAEGAGELNVVESGLTARFMITLACVTGGEQIVTGKGSIMKRPVADLVEALRSAGADITYLGEDGCLPLKVSSSILKSSSISIDGSASSQFLSALLLIAPTLPNGLVINVPGGLTSKPYVDMTIKIMKHFGVTVDNKNYAEFSVRRQNYIANDYTVESDYSSASYFFAAAALTNSTIKIPRLNLRSKQADINFLDILEKLGAKIRAKDDTITVTGNALKPMTVDMNNCPDQAMTMAVLLAFAKGTSKISNIASLRLKETERISAVQNELAKMGVNTTATADSLTIYGGYPHQANIDTYSDHRMAMAFSVASLKLPGINIFNPAVVKKSYPGYWQELSKITRTKVYDITQTNVVLTGMRGTGKSTVGKIVAGRMNMDFVDTDRFIESKHRINIKSAVKRHGWEYFRKLESEAIAELSGLNNTVISTGAGAILDPANVKNLCRKSLIFMLKADPSALAKRISRYHKLPALTKHKSVDKELREVWLQRKQLYYSSADFIIITDRLDQTQVAEAIIAKLKS